MIQDIKPFEYHVEYKESLPDENSLIYIKHNGLVLLGESDDTIVFPKYSQLKDLSCEYVYLFSVGDEHLFYAKYDGEVSLPGFTYKVKNSFRVLNPKHLAFAGITAYQVTEWYLNNRFCGRCGGNMTHAHHERMVKCENCGNTVYPKISPAVIVAVTNGDKLLVTKYAGRANTPGFALVAGFTEVGETIEDTVRREVFEETGVHVKNITFYKSQPWSFSDSLLFGFFCELDGSDEIHIQESELSVAKWIHRDEINIQFNDLALTNEMICVFRDGRIYG